MKKLLKLLVILVSLLITFSVGQSTKGKHKSQGVSVKVVKTAQGHSASLSCATTESKVNGCNFYRGTTAGGESGTPVNPTLVPVGTAYVDSTVVANTTYFYTAKANCPSCSPVLSNSSNEVSAVIPGDIQPNPPVLTLGPVQ